MARFYAPSNNPVIPDVSQEIIDFLSRLNDDYSIFLNAQTTRQTDLVIVSPNAMHVFEIKDKRGNISVNDKGEWSVNGEPIVNLIGNRVENPVQQSFATAKAFENFLKKNYPKLFNKKFFGIVFPYVLVPFASAKTRSNLSQVKSGFVWILTSLSDVPNSIVKRDQQASYKAPSFFFSPSEIKKIAKSLGLVEIEEINGIRLPYKEKHLQVETPKEDLRDKPSEPLPQKPQIPKVQQPPQVPQTSQAPQTPKNPVPAKPAKKGISCGVTLLIALFFLECGITSLGLLFWLSYNDSAETSPSPTSSAASKQTTPITLKDRGLKVSVEKIEKGTKDFRIWLKATNESKDTLTTPLFENFFVVDNIGNQYKASVFESTFPYKIAPGATVSGYVVMDSPLNQDASSITIIFEKVYGPTAQTLTISNIPVP